MEVLARELRKAADPLIQRIRRNWGDDMPPYVIAGNSLNWLHTGKPWRDIDVYFHNEDDWRTANDLFEESPDERVQFVRGWYGPTATAVIQTFDFNFVQCGTTVVQSDPLSSVAWTPGYVRWRISKNPEYIPGQPDNSGRTVHRIMKFLKRGYFSLEQAQQLYDMVWVHARRLDQMDAHFQTDYDGAGDVGAFDPVAPVDPSPILPTETSRVS